MGLCCMREWWMTSSLWSANSRTLNSSREPSGFLRPVSPCTPLGAGQQLLWWGGARTFLSPGTWQFIPPNTLRSKSPFWLFVEVLDNSWYCGIIRFNFFKPCKFKITCSRIQKSQMIHMSHFPNNGNLLKCDKLSIESYKSRINVYGSCEKTKMSLCLEVILLGSEKERHTHGSLKRITVACLKFRDGRIQSSQRGDLEE